jgi:tellurite resistance protein TehA-like permease
MKTTTFNKIWNTCSNILFYVSIIVFFLFLCAVGFYRMYTEEENKYLLNDYLKKELNK